MRSPTSCEKRVVRYLGLHPRALATDRRDTGWVLRLPLKMVEDAVHERDALSVRLFRARRGARVDVLQVRQTLPRLPQFFRKQCNDGVLTCLGDHQLQDAHGRVQGRLGCAGIDDQLRYADELVAEVNGDARASQADRTSVGVHAPGPTTGPDVDQPLLAAGCVGDRSEFLGATRMNRRRHRERLSRRL